MVGPSPERNRPYFKSAAPDGARVRRSRGAPGATPGEGEATHNWQLSHPTIILVDQREPGHLMPNRTSVTGSELFIVDNSDTDWKVLRYLHDWCQLSQSIDIATGYFEIGALLIFKDN